MRSSRRSRSADADDGSGAAAAEEEVIDEAMRKRYAKDRGLSPFATWDEITAHDAERRRARLDSLVASPPAIATPAPTSSLARTSSAEVSLAQMAQRNCELELLVDKLQDQLRESMEKTALVSSMFSREQVLSLSLSLFLSLRVCLSLAVCVRARVCVRVRACVTLSHSSTLSIAEQAALKDTRLFEARHRLSMAANVSARLETVQNGAAALVDAVPIDQQV